MKLTTKLNILLFFIMILYSCSSSPKSQVENIADGIEVSYETGPKIGQNQILTFCIENQTQFCFSFPRGYGIKIFSKTSNGWIEVPNRGKFLGTEPRLLKPKEDFFSEDSVDVFPDISGLGLVQPTDFYVSISGSLCEDETVVIEKKIPFVVAP